MNVLKRFLAVIALIGVAACGGGGGDRGAPPFGSGGGGNGGGGGGGGGGATPPAAADLILETSSTQLANTASSSITLTVTAVDASRVVVSGASIAMQADNDGVITQSAAVTDAAGKVTGSLSIGGNRANRLITVSVSSGTVTRSAQIQVVGTRITSTLVPAVVAPSAAAQVQYRVVDQTGNPMAAQAISISAPGLTPPSATGTTGTNGEFTYNYTSSASPGSFQIAASVGGLTDTQTVNVQAAASVPAVTVPISSASVSANPSVVGVNPASSTTNRSEIRALFLTAGNQPIRNVRVRFDLAGDANGIGGAFSTGVNTLYSDDNGVVTTAYIPGGRASPTNGVTVRACYGTTDSDPNLVNCTTNSTVRLTVVAEPLGVSIGTNETIVVSELSYTKRFLVSVADSAGNAKGDVGLSVSLDLTQYRKGSYFVNGSAWTKSAGSPPNFGLDEAVCVNEDTNRNGVLETGEDRNGNGRLDPGRSDVTVRLLQPRTGPEGTAIIEVTYAKSFGSWVDAWITVAASGVSGTEGRATYVLAPVPVDAAAIRNTNAPPAFQRSPYGVSASCLNAN